MSCPSITPPQGCNYCGAPLRIRNRRVWIPHLSWCPRARPPRPSVPQLAPAPAHDQEAS